MARIREISNVVNDMSRENLGATVYRFGVQTIAQLVNPLTPHIAEEMWRALGHTEMLVDTAWPSFDPALLADDEITLAVQVNGKLRGTITVAKGADNATCEAAALELTDGRRSDAERVWVSAALRNQRVRGGDVAAGERGADLGLD